jgi:UDP-GlcNAc:undecaprenyl-phosphate GlcNAc-1-phosphate transferase
VAITFLWLAVISNAVNFLDNMDGLCAGVSGIAAAYIALLAALNDQFLIAPMAAAIFGACIGFLRYNFKPATIFMGDAGSLLLGFLLAIMTLQLRFPDNVNTVTWMVPLAVLGVPLFDLTLVTVSRLRRGVNPLTTAGKDHTSHRLVRVGLSQREAVMAIYLAGAAFGVISVFMTQADILEAYVMGGAVVALAVYLVIWFERKNATVVSPKER